MRKRLLSVLLACVLCMSFCFSSFAADNLEPIGMENHQVTPTGSGQTTNIPTVTISKDGYISYSVGACATGSSITVTISSSSGSGSVKISGSNGGSTSTVFGTAGTTLAYTVSTAGTYTVTITNTSGSGLTIAGSIYAYKM